MVLAGGAIIKNVFEFRAAGIEMIVQPAEAGMPMPGEPALAPTDDSKVPEFVFFIYDHLGNTRVMYSNNLVDCDPAQTEYLLEHVIDYYPYAKTLREYVYERERFQSTYHERDEETGLDYRGARFYDSDVGRFLSTDPLASAFPGLSTYNYVLNDPVRLFDPTGRYPEENLSGLSAKFGSESEKFKEEIRVSEEGDYSITAYLVNDAGVNNMEKLVNEVDRIFRRNGINGEINYQVISSQEGFNLPRYFRSEDKSIFLALTNYAYGRLGASDINNSLGTLGVWEHTASGICRFSSCVDVSLHQKYYGNNWSYHVGLTIAHEYSHQLDVFSLMMQFQSLDALPYEGHYGGINLLMDGQGFGGVKRGGIHELLPPEVKNRVRDYINR